MELQRLSLFLQIVEHGSLSAAARRVHLTQPALSRNLKLLEEELGVELFHRAGRGLTLTAAGRALATRANALLDDVAHVELSVRRCAERGYFDVRLGAVDSAATYLLPGVLERLHGELPELAVRLTVGRSPLLLERIQHGALDLAVVASSGPPATLAPHRLLGRYALRFYGRADRFPKLARVRSLTGLTSFPSVQLEPGPGQPSLTPDGALSHAVASNVATVKALVLAGFGIGDLPEMVLSQDERRRLVEAPIELDPHCGLFLVRADAWVGDAEGGLEERLAAELAAALRARRSGAKKRSARAAGP